VDARVLLGANLGEASGAEGDDAGAQAGGVVDQGGDVEAVAVRRDAGETRQTAAEQGDRAVVVAPLEVEQPDTNLQDPLVQLADRPRLGSPELLEHLVLVEVLAGIEQLDPADEQRWRRIGRHCHARTLSSRAMAFADADIAYVQYDAGTIQRTVAEMGAAIARDYKGRTPVIVSVLKGATPLIADLARAIDGAVELDFIGVTSFGPAARDSGVVRLTMDLTRSIERRDVLLIEDVVDTGLTLAYVLKVLRTRRPASLAVGTLLDKRARRLIDVDLRYRGLEAPDSFYVGYGLDYRQRYRNLPYIGVLRPELLGR
jgi:hypoxanthine phosphoribosyltransferase